jgi:hypothetical protein
MTREPEAAVCASNADRGERRGHEVPRLVALLPLARLVALIDQTTDRNAAQASHSSGRRISAPQSSPLVSPRAAPRASRCGPDKEDRWRRTGYTSACSLAHHLILKWRRSNA